MPPLPGEERLLTVFADIHYYFTSPCPKPLIHRFNKGSYLYLYHNASLQKTRIEVANNPGTPDQDAFNGALDNIHLRHSTRFATLCTITVDGQPQAQAFPLPPSSTSAYEWQLPTNDTRSENQTQRLNTLDIYFWTQDDVNQFLDLTERYLPRAQIETDRHPFPPPAQTSATSTVVQQLENVAITDPAYQNGQTRNSQSEVVANPAASSLPPPPSGPPPPATQITTISPPPSVEEKKDPAQFTPLPYNPAAPAAPEPIQHREKTPPPPDAADGTGLAAAVAADSGAPPYSPPSHQLPAGGYAPSPPSQGTPYSIPGSYASPPPSAGLGSFPSRSSVHAPPGVPSYAPSFLAGAPQQQMNSGGSMSFAPPPTTDPNAHLYGGQNIYGSQAAPPLAQPAVIPPIGGYSNYSYDQAPKQHHQPGASSEYDVHGQLYRPTEAEANSHLQKHAQQAVQNPGQRGRRLEDSATRVESSVNRFLKKLEKKL